MADPRPLTRNELAKFLPDLRAIRAFEKLFDLIPEDLTSLMTSIDEALTDANSANTQAQLAANRRSFDIDYIDFDPNAPYADKANRLAWKSDDDTLNLHHSNSVIQKIGENIYMRAINTTGSQIDKALCVSIDGASSDAVEITKFLADGVIPTEKVVGITTEDIADTSKGRVTVWGSVKDIDTTGTPYTETWLLGDQLYASPTTSGGLTNVKPGGSNVAVPLAIVVNVDATEGEIFVNPVIEQEKDSKSYGAFSKTTDQTPSAINTADVITFDATQISSGFAIDGTFTSRIVANNPGIYSFDASFQLVSNDATVKNVWLWFRKNGTDIVNSAMKISLESATALSSPSRNMLISLVATDYVELVWAADDTNVTLDTLASTAFAPGSAACILTVEQTQE